MDSPRPDSSSPPPEPASFAETALKLGGKSDEEARRTGAIDSADDQVERLFQPQYQTINSPVHKAVWDRVPVELFDSEPLAVPPEVQQVMTRSLEVVAEHKRAGTVHNEEGKIHKRVLADLGTAGYWGLLVDREYGGSGAPFRAFARFLTQMATLDPTIAGLASVHGCIGAVDPVRTFGTPEQKQRFLPDLASGRRLSAFALTEPNAGSDLTALRTRAELRGDTYYVTGEKLFMTNVALGRAIGLVCLIEGRPAVLVCDLPQEESEAFRLRDYGLWALKHTYNRGLIFNNFPVPAANLLDPGHGNGLTIAYHGLNLGRVALCANAAGTMRLMLASMLPWAKFRRTYGEPIAKRELVRRRIARLAGLIVGCDALVAWCSTLLDAGYRGEMECIVAKIFGSESQKEAAIELCMKTHGGRAFLHGHMFGDHVHEYLAPCIYEGEGEMLGMAFFKSLVKHHGTQFFEPVGRALQENNIRKLNPLNPAHLWALKGAMAPYMAWLLARYVTPQGTPKLPEMPAPLRKQAEYAIERLQSAALDISSVMRKHQLKLADRQCRMSELSARIQTAVVMLCTALYAARQEDPLVQRAAALLCRDLNRGLLGRRASDGFLRESTTLGGEIAEGGCSLLEGIEPEELLMPYENEPR